jgi:hypothetical protein
MWEMEASGVSWGSAAHDRADHFCEPAWPEVVKPATAEVADGVGVAALGTADEELNTALADGAGPDGEWLTPGLAQAPMTAITTSGPANITPMRLASVVSHTRFIDRFPPNPE